MTLDENIYNDPFKFNPGRYLPKPEGNGEPHPSAVYGWGRRFVDIFLFIRYMLFNTSFSRVCPGRYFADANLWIAITTILATLDISKAIDHNGNEITPVPEFSPGLVACVILLHVLELKTDSCRQPVPYECTIKPRSKKTHFLIAQVNGACDNYL